MRSPLTTMTAFRVMEPSTGSRSWPQRIAVTPSARASIQGNARRQARNVGAKRFGNRTLAMACLCSVRFNLRFPLRVVYVVEDPGTDALVEFSGAPGAAIEFLPRPVRKYFPVAEHAEQQVPLCKVGDPVLRVFP